jgi:hypothetical protein
LRKKPIFFFLNFYTMPKQPFFGRRGGTRQRRYKACPRAAEHSRQRSEVCLKSVTRTPKRRRKAHRERGKREAQNSRERSKSFLPSCTYEISELYPTSTRYFGLLVNPSFCLFFGEPFLSPILEARTFTHFRASSRLRRPSFHPWIVRQRPKPREARVHLLTVGTRTAGLSREGRGRRSPVGRTFCRGDFVVRCSGALIGRADGTCVWVPPRVVVRHPHT